METIRWDMLKQQCPTRQVLTRTVYATVPVTVEYRLTDLGRSLGDTVGAIRSWAYANMDEIEAARERYDLTSHAPVTTLNAA